MVGHIYFLPIMIINYILFFKRHLIIYFHFQVPNIFISSDIIQQSTFNLNNNTYI